MKSLIVVASLLVLCHGVSFVEVVLEEWEAFKLEHDKRYESNVEEKFRLKIFMENKHRIAKHNAKYESGEISYKLKLNKFGDLLGHEFRGYVNGYNRSKTGEGIAHSKFGSTFIEPHNIEVPKTKDWRQEGAVTDVKDQGHCGSCWSFSATGALEGQHFRKTGKLISLSEQNLIDCSTKYGNEGCNGGLMDQAFQYVKDNHGIDTEDSYSYEGQDDQCRYDASNVGATDSGFVDIESGNERKLMKAIATVGPVSVAIDASHETFQFYSGDVYFEPQCSNVTLDHGVLAVGYGTDEASGMDYWLIKNSWGEGWGDKGYIKMARNRNNNCGVATQASYPLV